MPDPVTELAVAPTSRPSGTGVLLTVTGPVNPAAQIKVYDDNDRLIVESPEFGQKNKLGLLSEVDVITVTGTPGGGTFTLTAAGVHVPVPSGFPPTTNATIETGTIAHNASASAVQAACEAAWGSGSVAVTGTSLATGLTLTFQGEQAKRAIVVTSDASGLTGGSGPDVTVDQSVIGGAIGVIAGGPYDFGPLHLADGDYTADVKYVYGDDYAYGDDSGDSLLDSPVTFSIPD